MAKPNLVNSFVVYISPYFFKGFRILSIFISVYIFIIIRNKTIMKLVKQESGNQFAST